MACDPERVIVTSGMAQGMALFARALVARGGRRIGVEDPSSAPGREQLAANGLEIVPVPVDDDGLRVDVLDDARPGRARSSPRPTSSRSAWCSRRSAAPR